jgi:serine/threonine protein kinase
MKIDIIRQTLKRIDCLIDNNLFYTDIKPDNFLYCCSQNKNKIDVIIGDLGSISTEESINKRGFMTQYSYTSEKDSFDATFLYLIVRSIYRFVGLSL